MTCDEARERLDDHLEGALEEAEAVRLREHLASCAACRAEEQDLRAVVSEAGALPRELTPSGNLWPAIAARLAPRRAPLTLSWTSALAAAAALVAVSSLLTAVAVRGRPSPAPAVVPALLPATTAGADALRRSEAEYVRATAALLAALEQQKAALPPATVQALEENLRTIDQALAEIRTALAQDPASTELAHMLVSTHRKKLDTLERVLKLSTRA